MKTSKPRTKKTAPEPATRPCPPTFYLQDNIGAVKYTVSFHDGTKTHPDGSSFFDLETFSNKRRRDSFLKELIAKGYSERGAAQTLPMSKPTPKVDPPLECVTLEIYLKPHPRSCDLINSLAVQALNEPIQQIRILGTTEKAIVTPGKFVNAPAFQDVGLGHLVSPHDDPSLQPQLVAKRLVDAAIHHSEDAGEDHWKGDLEECLAAALECIAPPVIANTFLKDENVRAVLANL